MSVSTPGSNAQIEQAVAAHYGDRDLLGRILNGLQASGLDPEKVSISDLAPVDEFHIGGREATVHTLAKLRLQSDQHLVDVGCGIGGAARYAAQAFGCQVTGIDLTEDYILVAKELTGRTGLADKLSFNTASALDMPFNDATFDAGMSFHVAMNIKDRSALYGEMARILKPGAGLCLYDVMKMSDAPIEFPVPWAEDQSTAHLTSVEDMHVLLGDAGFDVVEVDDRKDAAIEFFNRRLATISGNDGPPPPLGIHLILGESAVIKFRNTLNNILSGAVSPVVMRALRR